MDPTGEVKAEIGTVIAIGGETIGSAFSGIGVVVLVLFVAKTAWDTDFFEFFGEETIPEDGLVITPQMIQRTLKQWTGLQPIRELNDIDWGEKEPQVTYHPEWKVLLDPLPPKIPEVPESFPVSVIPGVVILTVEEDKSEEKKDKSNHKTGENGIKIPGSKTVGQNGSTERVDVENPNPGKGNGNLHYHEPNNTKWYYDFNKKILVDSSGNSAPPKIQKVLKLDWIRKAIKKGKKLLGE